MLRSTAQAPRGAIHPFLTFAAATLLAACGASQAAPEPATAVVGATSAPSPADCDSLGMRLCEELGAETDACAATKQVAGWLAPEACTAGLARVDYSVAQIGEQRESCSEFARRVCGEFGEDSEPCVRVRADMPEIPPGSCPTLLARYSQIVGQLRVMVQRNRPLSPDQQQLLLDGSPPSFGTPGGKVTIVEFSDFQCPYCSMAAQTVHRIKAKYGDRVHFVFRQFPLSFHADAHLAAEAALAAHAQGKFWALHDAMFEHQDALGRADLDRYAKDAGLEMKAFGKALDEGAQRAAVDADMALGKAVSISGTPAMFINGTRIENPTDFDAVSAAIDAQLDAPAPSAPTPAPPGAGLSKPGLSTP